MIQLKQKIQSYTTQEKTKKPFSKVHTQPKNVIKIHTEPQVSILNDTSHKSLKKQMYFLNKKILYNKSLGSSKLGSKNTSNTKMKLLQNEIDINLHNFITISTQLKKQSNGNKNQGKEMFWNRRLKKKQTSNFNGVYADIVNNHNIRYKYHNSNNRSLNISPREVKKQKKQKQLKQTYLSNSKQLKRTKQLIVNDNIETLKNKKEKRGYQNQDLYKLKRFSRISKLQDRSKSVVI